MLKCLRTATSGIDTYHLTLSPSPPSDGGEGSDELSRSRRRGKGARGCATPGKLALLNLATAFVECHQYGYPEGNESCPATGEWN